MLTVNTIEPAIAFQYDAPFVTTAQLGTASCSAAMIGIVGDGVSVRGRVAGGEVVMLGVESAVYDAEAVADVADGVGVADVDVVPVPLAACVGASIPDSVRAGDLDGVTDDDAEVEGVPDVDDVAKAEIVRVAVDVPLGVSVDATVRVLEIVRVAVTLVVPLGVPLNVEVDAPLGEGVGDDAG